MKYTKLPIIYVVWNDSTISCRGWQPLKSARKTGMIQCHTTGWLIKETKKALSIAQSYHPDDRGRVTEVIVIPKGCVVKRELLKDKQ